jgi:hypothetical protein
MRRYGHAKHGHSKLLFLEGKKFLKHSRNEMIAGLKTGGYPCPAERPGALEWGSTP